MHHFGGRVGFFDSGIGGLSVLRTCKKIIPNVPFYYLGDNARAPYGNLPTYLIRTYTHEAMERFVNIGVNAVVLACNTVTAVCVDELRKEYNIPIIGVEPAVLPAAKQGGRIGVLATRATLESVRFQMLLQKVGEKYPQARLIPLACDGLAGAIENGLHNPSTQYDTYLPNIQLDGVVLGCTHYVFIRRQIERFYQCPTFDGNTGVATRLKYHLEKDKALKNKGENDILVPLSSTCNHSPIFFLGARNTQNKRVYEQMFAKIKGKVVKNPKKS